MKFEMTPYISNFNKLLVNYGEHIFLQLKIYQIKRSITNSKSACPSISWYIIVFVISSLMIKAVSGFEKWCLCNDYYSCPVVTDLIHVSNLEDRFHEFLICHFKEYWGYAYTTTSTICDILVIIAALIRNYHQLVYPWLCIKGITLIGEMLCILKEYCMNDCKPTTLQLVVLAHASYSWYFIYIWSS
ncbi:uncharacterized protein LOC114126029 [Aphis gossypii]|nr:uncharacterized protein LOC114126029 [Aphis gossypii]